LLIAEDAKFESLKFAILFTIADMFWAKKNKTNACYQRIQKIRNRNLIHSSFTPLISFTLAKLSFNGVNHSPGLRSTALWIPAL